MKSILYDRYYKMSFRPELFHVSFDDTGIQRILDGYDRRLQQHEEMILELQKLIKDLPTKDYLKQMNDQLRNEMEGKMNQFQAEVTNNLNKELAKMNKTIEENKHPEAIEKLNDLGDKFNDLEARVKEGEKTKEYVQTIASAFAAVNKTQAPLNESLPRTLYTVADFISSNIKKLNDNMKQVRNDLKSANTGVQEKEVTVATDSDISHLELRPESDPKWEDRPQLPELTKFGNLADNVDYIYQMVPQLQGYLNVMHDKTDEIAKAIENTIDKDGLQELLEKIRGAIVEMNKDLTDLRKSSGKALTKSEILGLIKDQLSKFNETSQTSIGCVKCIACGRDMHQVSGAITEEEAIKTLGSPPNSVAMFPNSDGHMGQMYMNSEVLNTSNGILESPRSIRPYRGQSVKVYRRPRPPS